MNRTLLDAIEVFNAVCWPVCFWWMHRISKNQTAMLKDLRQQAGKMHDITREGHEVIKEIEPKVARVAAKIDQVTDAAA